jgi:tetratricopeptide (TPR) repeat protein
MNDKIRVFRPAFIASLACFAIGFWHAVLPGVDPGAGYVAGRTLVGIVSSVLAFLVVFVWQGARRYLTKPNPGQVLTKSKPASATAIASSETLLNKENEEQVPVKSDIVPLEFAEDAQKIPTPSLLATCLSCGHNFSKRATTCPKCSAPRVDQLAECLICKKQIPANSTSCPECGDSKPFECEEQIHATAVVNESPYPKGRRRSILKKTLKVLGILFLLFLLVLGAIGAYQYYEHQKEEQEKIKKEKEELGFDTSLKWDWHNRDNFLRVEGVQIHTPEGSGRSILRKVNLQKKSAIYAYKNDDYSLTTTATFEAKCQPEKEIVTSQTFLSGKPKKLVCNKDGNQLSFSCTWQRGCSFVEPWKEELDGYSIYESFMFWNFSKLDQEVTLSKQLAKPKSAGGAEEGEKKDSMPANASKGNEGTVQPKVTSNPPGSVAPNWQSQYNELYEKKNWPGAVKHALKWTKAQPRDVDAWNHLGIAHSYSKQPDKAIEAFQQAVSINPQQEEIWVLLGDAYNETKQYDKVIEAFQQAVRINPKNGVVWHALGLAYEESKQYGKAIEAEQQASHVLPENATTWYNLGTAFEKTKQYDKAIEAYQQAVRINPEFAEARAELGVVYAEAKQYDKAIESLQQAVRIDPKKSIAWAFLGVAYSQTKQYDKAIESLQQAVRIEPKFAVAWYSLGRAYNETKQSAKANDAFQQATSIDPKYAEAWVELAVTYEKTDQYDKAIEAYQQAVRINPEYCQGLEKPWYCL